MPAPPWSTPRGLEPVVGKWLASKTVRPCFNADETLAGRDATMAEVPRTMAPAIVAALKGRGITSLYSHQAQAFEAASSGRSFVVATPTASGKSLCFHLPVVQALHDDAEARALYLFPTKALSRDQEASVRTLLEEAGKNAGRSLSSAVVFDGDTPGDARRAARERGGIILTNPDMLHAGVLPHHANWARMFQNLKYVVVDEMHTYRGVFGSHVANVLRRLRRVAAFHGANPIFIGATATIGNPLEHASRLFGMRESEVELVSENGAPRGDRRFFLFNPPVVNAELGIRASYVKQAVMLAKDLVRAHVPTIVFGSSRNSVEVMLRYLRDAISPEVDPSRVMAYRGGYLPAERREIERKLREGELLAVVATNALELGIDIGDLDAVICASYPGSVAAMWQRFGRAGRRCDLSIAVLVTSSAPLDQYLASDPSYLLGAPIEEARIDPNNVEVIVQHLKCAAFELPFRAGEGFGDLEPAETREALEFLARHQVVHESNGTFHWATDSYPANNVSLRSIGWDNVVIIDVEHDKTIGELDWRAAHTMLHEQAIYQHDGETWQVEKFDYENHKAFIRKVEPDYYTDAMTYTQIRVLEESATGPLVPSIENGGRTPWPSGWGEVSVVDKVVGYKKIKFYTHENAGYGDVRLPEMQMHTTAFWMTVPESVIAEIPFGRAAAVDALRGIGVALETSATLALMCDPRDIGNVLGDADDADLEEDAEADDDGRTRAARSVPKKTVGGGPKYNPTLFLYEHVPGGTGLAERIYEERATLLLRVLRMLERCPCKQGCPACVGPVVAMPPVTIPGAPPELASAAPLPPAYARKAAALDLLRRAIATC